MKVKNLMMVVVLLYLGLFAGSTTWATWVNMDKPNGLDYVIVDPSTDYDGAVPSWFTGNPQVVTNLSAWTDVTDYLDDLAGKSVALLGHGNVGLFAWNEETVLYDSTQTTKDWLGSMKDNVNYLGFISCLTGQGEDGYDFLSEVAGYLGKSYGYTASIRLAFDPDPQWQIEEGGSLVVVPEPSTVLLLGLGSLALLHQRRR